MKTVQAIVELARESRAGVKLAMATVMKVRGSAYRRPGARMLVTADGRSAGMISGGCLEEDVRERARGVMASGKAELVTYDSTAPEEIIFGLGLGCNGVVQILIEPVVTGDESGILAFLDACVSRRQKGRIATVFRSETLPLGTRVMRWPDGRVTSTSSDPLVLDALISALRETATARNAIRTLDVDCDRSAMALLEAIAPPVPLTVIGAGDDALPLVHLAKSLGWHVTVLDARPAYAKTERFPMADAVHCVRPDAIQVAPCIVFPPESMVMIMTHNFTHDKALLRNLLPGGVRYAGVLGPKSRTTRLLEELASEGVSFDDEQLSRLHGPAGLDIGSETPEEIAVSIIAEMQAVLADRPGGALRDRNAPIHDPVDQPTTTL